MSGRSPGMIMVREIPSARVRCICGHKRSNSRISPSSRDNLVLTCVVLPTSTKEKEDMSCSFAFGSSLLAAAAYWEAMGMSRCSRVKNRLDRCRAMVVGYIHSYVCVNIKSPSWHDNE